MHVGAPQNDKLLLLVALDFFIQSARAITAVSTSLRSQLRSAKIGSIRTQPCQPYAVGADVNSLRAPYERSMTVHERA
jgi:hypothetical protein